MNLFTWWPRPRWHDTGSGAIRALIISEGLATRYPEANAGRRLPVQPLRQAGRECSVDAWLLLGAVTLVLLIASVNVASLLLAARCRERGSRCVRRSRQPRPTGASMFDRSAILGLFGGTLGGPARWLSARSSSSGRDLPCADESL